MTDNDSMFTHTLPRATLRRVGHIFRPYSRHALLIVLTIIATSILGVVNPLVSGRIIDYAFPHQDRALLTVLVLALLATDSLYWLIYLAQSYLSATVGQRIMRDLRVRLYTHLQRLALRFYTAARTGELISRLSNDVDGVESVVTDTFNTTLANLVTLIISLVVLLRLNAPLTLILLGLLPFFLYLTRWNGQLSRRVSNERQQTLADVAALLEETLNVSGALLLKSFGCQSVATARFIAANERLLRVQLSQALIGRRWAAIIHLFYALLPALVYYVGGRQVIGGTLSLGSLVTYTMLQYRLFNPIGALLDVHVAWQGALALFDRIFAYLDLPVEIADRPDAVVLKETRGHIRFRSVSFSYQPDQLTLHDVNFEVQPGQLVALVGPSGAGKTTISYLLARLYDVKQGTVEIDGHDVRTVALASLARHIGMVTQETYLLNATVRENIAYGRPDASEAELVAAATAAHIHERILALPNGYATIVGARGYTLSGGEKQRIALARVLLKDPRILILDEATSALDTQSERLIQAALDSLMAGRTTLAVAHRLSTILAADQILVMDAGRIVERGTHAMLLARGGIYTRLYHEQFGSIGNNILPVAATVNCTVGESLDRLT
jgi:ATP-binding cassette, subfamily B, bacterial